jgi:chromosome segregation ATPase
LDSLKIEFDRNMEIQTQSLSQVTRALEDARIEKALIEEAIESSQANLRQTVATHKSLQTQIESLDASKEHLTNTINGLNEEISQKRELNDLLESQTKVLVEDRELRCSKLDKSIAELDGVLSARRAELIQANGQFESVQNHHRQLTADIDHLNRVKSAMETSVNELTDRLANKSTDFKRKSVQVNELSSKLDTLSQTVKTLAIGEQATSGPTTSTPTNTSGQDLSSKPSLQGPHWGPEHTQRVFDRMDDIEKLAQDGLD